MLTVDILQRQPLKTFYILTELASLCFRLPWWFITSLPKSWRPKPSWSIKYCLRVFLTRWFVMFERRAGGLVSFPDHHQTYAGKGAVGVAVDPADPSYIVGNIKRTAERMSVKPERVSGYWFTRAEPTSIRVPSKAHKDERVIYSLHGGAYVLWSAHPDSPSGNITRGLLEHCQGINTIFCLEYRRSSISPQTNKSVNPYPSALLDAIAGYVYLVHQKGYSPSNIILEGDSAGGNLALALTRYLIENQPNLPSLPSPSALLLLSPWSDLGRSHITKGSSALPSTYHCPDWLAPSPTGPGPTDYALRAFLGPANYALADSDPYVSPASLMIPKISFEGFPRTLIVSGGAETLLDMIKTLKMRMERDMGAEMVDYEEVPDAIHDFVCFEWCGGQREIALRAVGRWVG